MKPNPKGWPRISSSIFYDDPAAAIDWLGRAFGFTVRVKIEGEGGSIIHSELAYGDGLIMVSGRNQPHWRSPKGLDGAITQALFIYVDDVEAHAAHARAAGATIHKEPTISDYGDGYWADKGYEAEDPEGHRWWFAERIREWDAFGTAGAGAGHR